MYRADYLLYISSALSDAIRNCSFKPNRVVSKWIRLCLLPRPMLLATVAIARLGSYIFRAVIVVRILIIGFLSKVGGKIFVCSKLVGRSKVRIRSVASPMGRRCIQFGDGVVQSRLTLRVAVCD